jgi:hypothetical protein
MSFDNFAEGDSGVVMSPMIARWNAIQKAIDPYAPGEWKTHSFEEFSGMIIGKLFAIGFNSRTKAVDKVAALEAAWRVGRDYAALASEPAGAAGE